MLLRLQTPGAGVHVLPVWRDSVEPFAWRALAVAVRQTKNSMNCKQQANS
jgi:hypothetical protein